MVAKFKKIKKGGSRKVDANNSKGKGHEHYTNKYVGAHNERRVMFFSVAMVLLLSTATILGFRHYNNVQDAIARARCISNPDREGCEKKLTDEDIRSICRKQPTRPICEGRPPVPPDDPPDPDPDPPPPLPDSDDAPVNCDKTTVDDPDNGFEIILRGARPNGGAHVEMWRAFYSRGLPSGAYWVGGDRDGYRAAYMFLCDKNAKPVARVTFVGGYDGLVTSPIVFDKDFTDVCIRLYEGSPHDPLENRECNDAPAEPTHGEPFSGAHFFEMPIISSTGTTIETRGYRTTTAVSSGVTFQIVTDTDVPFTDSSGKNGSDPHTVYRRVTVGAFLDGKAAHSIYYDILRPGWSMPVVPL